MSRRIWRYYHFFCKIPDESSVSDQSGAQSKLFEFSEVREILKENIVEKLNRKSDVVDRAKQLFVQSCKIREISCLHYQK